VWGNGQGTGARHKRFAADHSVKDGVMRYMDNGRAVWIMWDICLRNENNIDCYCI
jgi:hypothetical protein